MDEKQSEKSSIAKWIEMYRANQSAAEKFSIDSWVDNLKETEDNLPSLTKFVAYNENFNNSKSTYDIILDFLTTTAKTARYNQLLNLIQQKKRANELSTIFVILEQIILRIRDNLEQYTSVGNIIVQHVCTKCMDNVYWMLGQKKPNNVKKTLKLLSVFVLLNIEAANAVLTHFDFTRKTVYLLALKSDKDEQNIRVCYIYFLLSFLFTENEKIFRQILEKPDLFRPIFVHLIKDRVEVIELFLSTILDKIISNSIISKSLKVGLVDRFILIHIAKLYVWAGPVNTDFRKKDKKYKVEKKNKDDKKDDLIIEPIPDAELMSEQERVNKITTQFLLALCTSKYGIIFQDLSLGAGKNLNHLITRLLFCIKNPYKNSYTTDLFVHILSSAPDQLKLYINSIENLIVPRDSPQWIHIINFITEIYDSQNIDNFLRKITTQTKLKDLTPLISTLLFPKVISRDVIKTGLTHSSEVINITTLDYLSHFAQRLSNFCTLLKNAEKNQWKAFDHSSIPIVIEGVGKITAKVLLEANEMDELWKYTIQAKKPTETKIEELGLMLDIQTTLQQTFPFLMQNWSSDLIDILIDKIKISNKLMTVDLAEFKFKIIGILLNTEPEKLLCGEIIEKLIELVSEPRKDIQVKATDFLIEIFIKSKQFENSVEINVWFKNFLRYYNNSDLLKEFFSTVTLETLEMISAKGLQIKENKINNIGSMLTSAFKILSIYKKYKRDKDFQKFFTMVLHDLYHMNQNYAKYLLDNLLLLPENFYEYLKICSLNGGLKTISKKKIEESAAIDEYLFSLMKYRNVKCKFLDDDYVVEKMEQLEGIDKYSLLYQILFYCDVICQEHNLHEIEFIEYFFKLMTYLIQPSHNGEFQNDLCTIILNHTVIKKCFLNKDFENINKFVLKFLISFIDHLSNTEKFKWYNDRALTFVENLTSFDKINSEIEEFVAHVFKPVSTPEVLRIFENVPETVLNSHSWLKKVFCEKFCDIIAKDQNMYLPNGCVELLLEQIQNKFVASSVKKLIETLPAYAYCFKQGMLKSFLVAEKQKPIKIFSFALAQNVFLQNEFEDLCLDKDLKDLNFESFILLFDVYMKSQITLTKNLLKDKQMAITEKIVKMTETLEEYGILSLNSQTVDIYLNLIDLNVKDLKSIQKSIISEMLVLENDRDLERIRILSRLSDDKSLWKRLMKKCFKRLKAGLDVYLLESLLIIHEKVIDFASEFKSLNWEELIKQILLTSMTENDKTEYLQFLLQFVQKCDFYLEPLLIANMIFGHSNFLNVMLSNNEFGSRNKELLIDILIKLTTKDRKIINSVHIPLYLASYNATLSSVDQKILFLLHLYSTNGVNFDEFRPCLWGPTAVNFYSIRKSSHFTLKEMPSVEDVLQHFDKDKLVKTAMNFPLDLVLEPKVVENLNDNSILDPRFLMSILGTLLTPSSYVNCAKFLDSNVLPIVFSSLSSNCCEMRRAGYYALMMFHEHLEYAKFCNKTIWLHLLSMIKNGITEENMKFPNILSVYLAKITPVLLAVQDPLHHAVTSFLLLKSDLNLKKVPDFLNLFNSSALQREKHRRWILYLLIDGVKDVNDYYLCESQFLNKIILSFCDSAICTLGTTYKILQLLNTFANIPTAARRLVSIEGLLPYLHRILLKYGSFNSEILTYAICFIYKLWMAILKSDSSNQQSEDAEIKSDRFDRGSMGLFSFAMEFNLICEACMDLIAVNSSLRDWELITSTLSSVYSHMSRRDDLKFYTKAIASTAQIEKLLKIHKIVMEKNNSNQDLHSRVLAFLPSAVKIEINTILLHLCFWTLENESFQTDIHSFCQTCFNAIEFIFTSNYFEESFQYQIDFLQLIKKLFSIKLCDDELISRRLMNRSLQNDNILSGLLQCYSRNNPYSGQALTDNKMELLIQQNATMRIVLMELKNHLSKWFKNSTDKERKRWKKAIDLYDALSTHKSSSSVSTQCWLNVLACEFLLRKSTPDLFDSLTQSSEQIRKLKKRSRETSGDDIEVKTKHKKKIKLKE